MRRKDMIMSWFLKNPPDFQAHNSEVAALWGAYHEGRPHRVPVSVVGSIRKIGRAHV